MGTHRGRGAKRPSKKAALEAAAVECVLKREGLPFSGSRSRIAAGPPSPCVADVMLGPGVPRVQQQPTPLPGPPGPMPSTGGGAGRRGRRGTGGRKDASITEAVAGTEAQQVPAPLQRPRRQQGAQNAVEPTWEVVSRALHSLYDDELKPFGRILRKRIAERAAGLHKPDAGAVKIRVLPDVDLRALVRACEEFQAAGRVKMEEEEAGEWSVTLTSRAPTFIDFYSSEDPYPAKLWSDAFEYLKSLDREEWSLPGGRYLCAQVLCARELPWLAGRSLGKICHIVQLGINQKKLLGYKNGQVVPYIHSDTSVKDTFAIWETRCPNKAPPATGGASPVGSSAQNGEEQQVLEVATWDVMKDCMRKILLDHRHEDGPTEPAVVPMSNVKRLFRSNFQLELSETALGHSKLSELLKDHRLREVCSVDLHGKGYIITEVLEAAAAQEVLKSPTSASVDQASHSIVEEVCEAKAADEVRYVTVTKHKPRPPTLLLADDVDPSDATSGALTLSSPISPPGSVLAAEARTVFPATPTSLPSPSNPMLYGKDTPRKVLRSDALICSMFPPEWVAAEVDSSDSSPTRQDRSRNSPNEPAVLPVGSRGGLLRQERRFQEDNKVSPSVRNTFIDGGPPPITPLAGSTRRRSQSLPKDVGSDLGLPDYVPTTGFGCGHAHDTPSFVGIGNLPNTPSVVGLPPGHIPDTPSVVGFGNLPNTPSVVGVGNLPNTPSVVGLGNLPNTPSVIGLGNFPNTPSAAGLGIKTPTPMSSPSAAQDQGHSIIEARAKLFFGLLHQQHMQDQQSAPAQQLPAHPVGLQLSALI